MKKQKKIVMILWGALNGELGELIGVKDDGRYKVVVDGILYNFNRDDFEYMN